MKAHFYYKRENALKSAERFANENDGFVKPTTIDDKSNFSAEDYDEEFTEKVINAGGWSGETNAFKVIDEQGNGLEIFAYWK